MEVIKGISQLSKHTGITRQTLYVWDKKGLLPKHIGNSEYKSHNNIKIWNMEDIEKWPYFLAKKAQREIDKCLKSV